MQTSGSCPGNNVEKLASFTRNCPTETCAQRTSDVLQTLWRAGEIPAPLSHVRAFADIVDRQIYVLHDYAAAPRREKLGKIYSVLYFSSVDVIMAGVATSSVKFLSPNRERERD